MKGKIAKKKHGPPMTVVKRRKAAGPDLKPFRAADDSIQGLGPIPTNISMQVDKYATIQAHLSLNAGIKQVIDPSAVRERIFGIVGTYGWEATLALLASCARLFAEVQTPTPLAPLGTVEKEFLHQFARTVDAHRQPLRHVDSATARKIK